MKRRILILTAATGLALTMAAGCSDHESHPVGHQELAPGTPERSSSGQGSASSGASGTATNAQTKPYPLETCVVSGEKLGEMGDPYVFVHQGQEIKLCCKSCLDDFNADPQKYLAKINQKAQ